MFIPIPLVWAAANGVYRMQVNFLKMKKFGYVDSFWELPGLQALVSFWGGKKLELFRARAVFDLPKIKFVLKF